MRVICKAASKWGGTGSTPSFSLAVHEEHSSLILAWGALHLIRVQGPKGAGSKGSESTH